MTAEEPILRCDQGRDEALLERVTAGDQEALKQLYALYRPRLWRYIWQQIGGDTQLAEEILQDVFLAVWHGARSFQRRASVSTWIFRIAHNIASTTSHARLRHTSRLAPTGPDSQRQESGYPSHEDEVLARITLADAVACLPAKHREVLELTFYQGFTCEEAGHILDVPTGTVKSRLAHARKELAGRLERKPTASAATPVRVATSPRQMPPQAGEVHHDS
jgi:RNA polymerase sigma-70 factor (ECF subfamily)